MEERNYEQIKFTDNEFELELSISYKEETIWLNQSEIAKLFQKARTTINEHITNIYRNDE